MLNGMLDVNGNGMLENIAGNIRYTRVVSEAIAIESRNFLPGNYLQNYNFYYPPTLVKEPMVVLG